jgi:membrane-associated phospholipid phosphatase
MDKYGLYHRLVSILYYIVLIGGILVTIILSDLRGLVFIFGWMLSYRVSVWLKSYIFRPLFLKYGTVINGNHYLPILGRGERPDSASDCSMFLTGNVNRALSWGFPSSHSFIAGVFTGIFGYYIIGKLQNDNLSQQQKLLTYISLFFVILGSIVSVYARVYVAKCHTIEQGIFGNLLGMGFGIGYYYLVTNV